MDDNITNLLKNSPDFYKPNSPLFLKKNASDGVVHQDKNHNSSCSQENYINKKITFDQQYQHGGEFNNNFNSRETTRTGENRKNAHKIFSPYQEKIPCQKNIFYIPKKDIEYSTFKSSKSGDLFNKKLEEAYGEKSEKNFSSYLGNRSPNSLDYNFLKSPKNEVENKDRENNLKNSLRDLSPQLRNRSNTPFLRIKEKLEGNFYHFLKRHRYSAILVGNKNFKGKNADYYLKSKNEDTIKGNLNDTINQFEEDPLFLNQTHSQKMNKNLKQAESNKIDKIPRQNLMTPNKNNKRRVHSQSNVSPNMSKTFSNSFIMNKNKKLDNMKVSNTSMVRNKDKLKIPKPQVSSSKNNKETNNKPNGVGQLKMIERILGLGNNSSSVELTPIPMRKTPAIGLNSIEYSQAERAAVTIRRIEYSTNVGSKETTKELENFCMNLLHEAKTIIIQRWWRKQMRKIQINHLMATLIQKTFRGFLLRTAFKTVLKQIYKSFPFLNNVNFIIEKKIIKLYFLRLKKRFAYLEFINTLTKKINLIIRCFRKFLIKRVIKQKHIKKSIWIISKYHIKSSFYQILNNNEQTQKIIKLQSHFRSFLVRNSYNKKLDLGKNLNPYLFYFLQSKNLKSVKTKLSVFANLKYFIKKIKFSNVVKRILYLLKKNKIQDMLLIMKKVFKKISNKRHFELFKLRLYNRQVLKTKLKILSNKLNDIAPIIDKYNLKMALHKWRQNTWKIKNLCLLSKNIISQILKIFIWKPLTSNVNLLQLTKIKNKFLIKLVNFRKKLISKETFEYWVGYSKLQSNKEIKLKKIIKKKDKLSKMHILKTMRQSCYYLYPKFSASLNMHQGVLRLKNLYLNNLIKNYQLGQISSLNNFKMIFKNNQKINKLGKILKIAAIYYLNKMKINFDQWVSKVNSINTKFLKKNIFLKRIVTNLSKKMILKIKILFSKWSIKNLKRQSLINIKNLDKTISYNKGSLLLNKLYLNQFKSIFMKLRKNILKIKNTNSLAKILQLVLKKNLRETLKNTFDKKFKNSSHQHQDTALLKNRLKLSILKNIIINKSTNLEIKKNSYFKNWNKGKDIKSISNVLKSKVPNNFDKEKKLIQILANIKNKFNIARCKKFYKWKDEMTNKLKYEKFQSILKNKFNNHKKTFMENFKKLFQYIKARDNLSSISEALSTLRKDCKRRIFEKIKSKFPVTSASQKVSIKLKPKKNSFKIFDSNEENKLNSLILLPIKFLNRVKGKLFKKWKECTNEKMKKLKRRKELCLTFVKQRERKCKQIIKKTLRKWSDINKNQNFKIDAQMRLNKLFYLYKKNDFVRKISSVSKDVKNKINFKNEDKSKLEKINLILGKIVQKNIRDNRLLKRYNFTLFKKVTGTLIIKACTLSFRIIFKNNKLVLPKHKIFYSNNNIKKSFPALTSGEKIEEKLKLIFLKKCERQLFSYFTRWFKKVYYKNINRSVTIISGFIFRSVLKRRMKRFFFKVKIREFVINLILGLKSCSESRKK